MAPDRCTPGYFSRQYAMTSSSTEMPSSAVQSISTPKALGNTDGMILVTVDTLLNRVILTSFVRDLLIQRPDGKFNRLSRFVPNNGNNQEAVEKLIDIYNKAHPHS